MRARIKPEEIGHKIVVDAHRRHFTHEWTEFPAEHEALVRKNPYLEIEPEPEHPSNTEFEPEAQAEVIPVEIEPEPEQPKVKRKVAK
jgi:hypothetical protein